MKETIVNYDEMLVPMTLEQIQSFTASQLRYICDVSGKDLLAISYEDARNLISMVEEGWGG